jgi:uncharacterized protein (DUF983 family)
MNDQDMNDLYPPQPAVYTGLRGLCPRCGEGHIFKGFLNLAPRCDHCDLDLSFADSGDGPAVFVMLIAGFLVLGLALYIEFTFEPPVYVHFLLTLPLGIIICLGLLRPLKGILIALQFRNKAEQGRLER